MGNQLLPMSVLLTVLVTSPLASQPSAPAARLQEEARDRVDLYLSTLERQSSALLARESQLNQQQRALLANLALTGAELQTATTAVSEASPNLREAAAQRANELNTTLSEGLRQLTIAQSEQESITRERAGIEQRRASLQLVVDQMQESGILEDEFVWQEQDEGNDAVDVLENALFELSIAADDRVPVTINSLPRPGALVYYVTSWGRKHGVAPGTLERQTNEPQRVYRGCYFIWAQWPDNTTTNRSRKLCIEVAGVEIDLQ